MASTRAARALPSLALLLLISQAAIVVTGGAVRLTGSGLGCPTWPECTPGSYFPVENQVEGTFHSWIEFANRLLTFVLVIFALATLFAVLRAGRKDLRILAVGQFLGIFGQGVLGGITVLTDLNPISVASHFLLSTVLIAAATSLHSRRKGPTVKTGVRGPLNSYSKTHVMWSTLVIILGTIVTGSGPHAGDINAPRLDIRIQDAARMHSLSVIILMLFTIVFYFRKEVSAVTKRRLMIFFGIALSQGAIGYIQYFLGVPELLVALHLLGTTLVWIAAWRIWLSVQFKVKEMAL
ncbi:MAG: COX15/CtaA family protein [Actinomycetales bacterium]|nr:COX15/CtaA family protein [Actinomycetales bacterium]